MKLTAIVLCLFYVVGVAFATLPCENIQNEGSILSKIFQQVAEIFTSSSEFWLHYKSDAISKLNNLITFGNNIELLTEELFYKIKNEGNLEKTINFAEFKELYYEKMVHELNIFNRNIYRSSYRIENATIFLRREIDIDILTTHKSLSELFKLKWNDSEALDDIFNKFSTACDNYRLSLPYSQNSLFFIGSVEYELYSVATILNDNFNKTKECLKIDYLKPELKNEAQACWNTTLKEILASAEIATKYYNAASVALNRNLWYVNKIPEYLDRGRVDLSISIDWIKEKYSK